jgi:RNA polymerase subunit RPABC4/transcription elongation factor Spt4
LARFSEVSNLMPFCPKCGKAVPEDLSSCPYCGSAIRAPSPPPPKVSHTWRNIAIVVIVIIVGVIGLSAWNSSSSLSPGIIPQEYTINIVNGLITVNAGLYKYYMFSVPSGASNAHVSGTFTASGGSGNDIVVLIMDSTNFINWQNGHSANTYYNSGPLTTSSFDVSLPAGESYYLVYSNTFSTVSSKNVQTTVNLIYTM